MAVLHRHLKVPKAAPYCHVILIAGVMLNALVSGVKSEKSQVASQPGSSFEFADIDTDRSGCVQGVEELQKFRLAVGRILRESLELGDIERALRAGQITHSADINGDGKICECDLLSILLSDSEPGLHRHAFRVYEDGSIFDGIDADKDGYLDDVTEKDTLMEKLAQCVSQDEARTIVDAMSKLEKDDGKLARTEYLLFLRSPNQLTSRASPSSHRHPHQPQPSPWNPRPVQQLYPPSSQGQGPLQQIPSEFSHPKLLWSNIPDPAVGSQMPNPPAKQEKRPPMPQYQLLAGAVSAPQHTSGQQLKEADHRSLLQSSAPSSQASAPSMTQPVEEVEEVHPVVQPLLVQPDDKGERHHLQSSQSLRASAKHLQSLAESPSSSQAEEARSHSSAGTHHGDQPASVAA